MTATKKPAAKKAAAKPVVAKDAFVLLDRDGRELGRFARSDEAMGHASAGVGCSVQSVAMPVLVKRRHRAGWITERG
jgi:hypothetical protein